MAMQLRVKARKNRVILCWCNKCQAQRPHFILKGDKLGNCAGCNRKYYQRNRDKLLLQNGLRFKKLALERCKLKLERLKREISEMQAQLDQFNAQT